MELGSVSPPALFFFKVVLATQGSLQFHMKLRIDFSVSAKKAAGILIGIVFKL